MVTGSVAARARMILAHGAGAAMDSAFMQLLADALAREGFEVVRFEFAYMAQRRSGLARRPPPPIVHLVEEWRQFVGALAVEWPTQLPQVAAGKSLGGRVASMALTAGRANFSGLSCFGYPFHPPTQPDRLRTAHLTHIQVPVLVLQGTRDRFGSPAEVNGYGLTGDITVHWLVGGDHDFNTLSRATQTQAELITEAAAAAARFSFPSPQRVLAPAEWA